jgi:hypothetical protein
MTGDRGIHPGHTVGDVGYLDDGGYLYLTDRATFMIISGPTPWSPTPRSSAFPTKTSARPIPQPHCVTHRPAPRQDSRRQRS